MIATPLTTPAATVYLDGEDVSDRCYYADDAAGIVGLYLRNANGRFYVVGTQADPNWQPGWPDERIYTYVDGEIVEVRLMSGYGEIAREVRCGLVKIELPKQVEDGIIALT